MSKKKKAPVKELTPIEFGWLPVGQYSHVKKTDGSLTNRSHMLLLSSKKAGVVPGYVEQYNMDVDHPLTGKRKKGDLLFTTVENVTLTDVEAFSAMPVAYKETPAGDK